MVEAGRRLAVPSLALLLTACAALLPSRPANVVIKDTHLGGSVLAFNPSVTLLASGGWEGRLQLWTLRDGRRVSGWRAHSGSVNGIAFTNGGRDIVTAGYDGTLAQWNIKGNLLRRKDTGHPVTAMLVDEGANRVVTGHVDGAVRIWRLDDFSLLRERHLYDGSVLALARYPAARLTASSGSDGRVFVWQDQAKPRSLPSPPTDAWSLVFSPDGKRLIGGGWFKLFRWDLVSARLKLLDTEHWGIIKSLAFSPNGQTLASISRQTDSSVYLLDPSDGHVKERLQAHDLCGGAIRYSSDGRYLATTSDDASVRIWDLKHLRPEH